MKTMNEIAMELAKPFPKESIHWRVGATNRDKTKGIALAYIDARDLMDRLDQTVGTENWQNKYDGNGLCGIGIKTPEGEWVWKWNAAGETKVEAEKGQASDSFKRAGVLWGVARYLYGLPNVWCRLDNGRLAETPELPNWALPGEQAVDQEEIDKLVITIKELIDNTPEVKAMVKTDSFAVKMRQLQQVDAKAYTSIKNDIIERVKEEERLDAETI